MEEARDHAQAMGARLPSLVEWEWAATLGLIAWRGEREWTLSRAFPRPYDEADGRNNIYAIDTVRISVGGGFSEDDPNAQNMLSDVQAFAARHPQILHDLTPTSRTQKSLEGDPKYLAKNPELAKFLRSHPTARDLPDLVYLANTPDSRVIDLDLAGRPTKLRIEATTLIDAFRLVLPRRLVGPVEPILVTFRTYDNQPDGESMVKLRKFAESWRSMNGHNGNVKVEGRSGIRGTMHSNEVLREQSVEAVKQVLVNEGIPETNIETLALGRQDTFIRDLPERISPVFSTKNNRVLVGYYLPDGRFIGLE